MCRHNNYKGEETIVSIKITKFDNASNLIMTVYSELKLPIIVIK